MRHAHASWLLAGGADLQVVKERLGHPPAQQPPPGQVEQALRNQGISEPALLARAAELDDKTRALISTATSIFQRQARAKVAAKHAREASPTGRQHPARLAQRDSSPATGAGTSLPKLVPIGHQIRHSTPAHRRHRAG
jgi:hypothetical protein